MATWRLSRLQQRILHWLAVDHQRTKGMIVSSHEDLIKALREDKSNISRSLRTLEGGAGSCLVVRLGARHNT
jgi:DNA-binding MarR family transcriptional regulator